MKKIIAILLICSAAFAMPDKCGIPDLMVSKKPLTATRPGLPFYWDTGHFRVWFDTSGSHAVSTRDIDPADGVPDWSQRAGEYLERARAFLVDTLGVRAPIPDSTGVSSPSDVGGDDRTDAYLLDMETYYGHLYYGITHLDELLPGGNGPAFVSVENDFAEAAFGRYAGHEEDPLAVTCAHEFFHVLHYAYGSGADWVWWMEATAVWSEERNFPNINDYIDYTVSFQATPELGLSSPPINRYYGTCLFPIYLTENYGDEAIRGIWDRVPDEAVYGAISLWSDSVGVGLDDLYGDFARWNLFTGDNYRGFGYPDAPLIDEPATISPDSVPATISGGGAAAYIALETPSGGGIWAKLSDADDLYAAMEGIPLTGTDTPDTTVDIFGVSGTIPGVWRFDWIIATLAHLSEEPSNDACTGAFSFGPDPSAKVAMPENEVDLPPYPNPFVYGESDSLYFPFSSATESPTRFSVWTAAGELVYQETGMTNTGYHRTRQGAFAWRPRNRSGRPLSSGIYVYILSLSDTEHIGKFAIINR